ncbi:hypothetical protein HMPREF0623_1289 [Pediococcus acidilactici DSM 20284]|uniref:Uncharacterized protein n=1 Tax=Pediococcus acidilactici DSM 20284 TaxID=862514 RepID=E0NG66_PEDAC|nr:hypothetical protein HMPREF0623_1289 [Pediococcus acidilactici DSM 20284]
MPAEALDWFLLLHLLKFKPKESEKLKKFFSPKKLFWKNNFGFNSVKTCAKS